jgi:hypothetical protein
LGRWYFLGTCYLNWSGVVLGDVGINLNTLWGASLWSFHIQSWYLDIILDHWLHSWEIGILFLAGIHSWDFDIYDEATVSICESHMVRLVAAECIDSSNHQIRMGLAFQLRQTIFFPVFQALNLNPPCRFLLGPRKMAPLVRASWLLRGLSSSCTWNYFPIAGSSVSCNPWCPHTCWFWD